MLDFEAIFTSLPTAYLVLDPDLRVVHANAAYLVNVGRTLEDLVGQPVAEAFPANPGDAEGDAKLTAIVASFERARDTGRPDVMEVLKYDIPDPATGGFRERYWSVISAPVPGRDGTTAYVLQRNEDVTDFVHERDRIARSAARSDHWQQIVTDTEASLFRSSQELRAAQNAEAAAAAKLAALADVTLALAGSTTTEQLSEIVSAGSRIALGADFGLLAVRSGEVLRSAFTSSVSAETREAYAEARLDDPLPPSVAAATGRQVVLRTRAEADEYDPRMAEVAERYRLSTVVSLPLLAGDAVLGSFTAFWRDPQPLTEEDLALLLVLTAQCAQTLAHIQTREAEAASAAAVSRLSETMQRSLLTEPADPAGLDVAVRYQPAARELQVGGDWYDAFGLGADRTLLVVGDVAGHDQDAAAVMAQVRNILRGVAHVLAGSPAAVLTALDHALVDLQVRGLATAVLATVGPAGPAGARQLTWSTAGHPPPVLIDQAGVARLLTGDSDLLLGLDPATDRTDQTAVLAPGATVLLYTDGLVERRGVSLDIGLAWLTDTCERFAELPVERLCDELLAQLSDQVEDDVALLAVRVLEVPS